MRGRGRGRKKGEKTGTKRGCKGILIWGGTLGYLGIKRDYKGL
jgi:hypothetical protein